MLETLVLTEVECTWTKGNGKNVQKLGIALLLENSYFKWKYNICESDSTIPGDIIFQFV